jgi:NADH-quinone oxidoreductase subunit C
MSNIEKLTADIKTFFTNIPLEFSEMHDELTVEINKEHLIDFCNQLRDQTQFKFEILLDVCGVDYSEYGVDQWATESTTTTGFSRGVDVEGIKVNNTWKKPRFAVVYHLLSITHNHRLRIRCFPDAEQLAIPSVINIWESANWFEREAFDLFGIMFVDHPDLRRILTDYGFIGHPFRKDFPLIGNVEVRYDATEKRVVYEPVSIEERTLVPKVIRDDNRYIE